MLSAFNSGDIATARKINGTLGAEDHPEVPPQDSLDAHLSSLRGDRTLVRAIHRRRAAPNPLQIPAPLISARQRSAE